MQDRPYPREAVAAVRDFLREELLPAVSGQAAYSVRVAANLLAIVERELTEGAELEREERTRLAGLVGEGQLREQNVWLADALRRGEIDPGDDALLQHLRLTARAKLTIANPRYL